MDNAVKYINDNGGKAEKTHNFSRRIDWDKEYKSKYMLNKILKVSINLLASTFLGIGYLAGIIIHQYHYYALPTIGKAYIFYWPLLFLILLLSKELFTRINLLKFIVDALRSKIAFYFILAILIIGFIIPVTKFVSYYNVFYVDFSIAYLISLVLFFQFYFKFK